MKNYVGTKVAAKKIGVKPCTLLQAVWNGRIQQPQKLGRSFAWSEENVNEARNVFGAKNVTVKLKDKDGIGQ